MNNGITYHPGARPLNGQFYPVVRVFEYGKPVGSKGQRGTLYPAPELARIAAYGAALKASLKAPGRVVVARPVAALEAVRMGAPWHVSAL